MQAVGSVTKYVMGSKNSKNEDPVSLGAPCLPWPPCIDFQHPHTILSPFSEERLFSPFYTPVKPLLFILARNPLVFLI